jgi:hypothetical protein
MRPIMVSRFDDHSQDGEGPGGDDQSMESEDFENGERVRSVPLGRRMSRDDLQDLAKVSSDLLRRTLVSGFDIVKEVSKELPKEATHFISARKEQVLQGVSKEFVQGLVNTTIDRLFSTVREHRLEVSFRIVRDKNKEQQSAQNDHQSQTKVHNNAHKSSESDGKQSNDGSNKSSFARQKRKSTES